MIDFGVFGNVIVTEVVALDNIGFELFCLPCAANHSSNWLTVTFVLHG